MLPLEIIDNTLSEKTEQLFTLSDQIWRLAELSYEEVRSAGLLAEALSDEGFSVEMGIAAMPTAFIARWGTGSPVMGFLGEFDALDALSQTAGVTQPQPLTQGAAGHGCGHNALGVGSLGAALALKAYLETTGRAGTVIFFGCPAEEGAGSKQFMARAGVFDGVDFVYTWHPADLNQVQSSRTVAIMGANFNFRGITAHAGSTPHLGRSALDAAELMSVGVNYLREHIIDGARVHYAYAHAGGTAPNVVQDRAVVKYEVRSPKVSQVRELFDRVVDVSRGAALMTQTRVEHEITMAFSDYIPNIPLARVADEALREVGPPQWEESDYELARAFRDSFNETTRQSMTERLLEIFGEERLADKLENPLDDEIHPFTEGPAKYTSGSTDVGDVAYAVPTINFNVATAFLGNVGHTWQMTAQSGSVLARKGMLTAARAMALAAVKTMDRPDVIAQAKAFVLRQNGGAYQCPLPDEVMPPVGRY